MKSYSCNGQKPMVVVDNTSVYSNKTSATNVEEEDNEGQVPTDCGSDRDEILHQHQKEEPISLQAMQANIETVPLTIESLFSSLIQ